MKEPIPRPEYTEADESMFVKPLDQDEIKLLKAEMRLLNVLPSRYVSDTDVDRYLESVKSGPGDLHISPETIEIFRDLIKDKDFQDKVRKYLSAINEFESLKSRDGSSMSRIMRSLDDDAY